MGRLGAGMPPAPAAVGGVRRFVDISVPRNIAADINELEGAARVFNVDDLKEVRMGLVRHVLGVLMCAWQLWWVVVGSGVDCRSPAVREGIWVQVTKRDAPVMVRVALPLVRPLAGRC